MLLADKSHMEGPIDIFKQTHVPKAGEKLVPDKPFNVIHCNDEDLLNVSEMQRGRRMQTKWSSDFKEFECIGNQRLMDKTVKIAKDKEDAEIKRMEKLESYFQRPQRGTKRGFEQND